MVHLDYVVVVLLLLLGVSEGVEWCSEAGCWPETWLLGGEKCGSTAVYSMLTYTFEMCGPTQDIPKWWNKKVFEKESHYWDFIWQGPIWPPDYAKLYPLGKCSRYLEATPYLSNPLVPPMVARFMPTGVRNAVKLIAVLREPIARELSLFNHERWSGFDWSGGSSTCSASKLPSFEAYAGCQVAIYGTLNATQNDDDTQRKIYQNLGFGLWKGMYIIHLATWRRSFDRNRVFVMSYDNLKPEDKMATDIAKFLDLYPFNRSVWFPVRNDHTFAAKQRTITCAIRDDLQAIFQPWNDLLYKKLQEDQDGRTAPQTEPPFPDFRLHPCVPNGSSSSS